MRHRFSVLRAASAATTLAAVAVFSACSSLPTVAPPPAPTAAADSPAQWNAPLPHRGELTALSTWWQQFDDPVLVQLIDAAQVASPTIASAAARIEQSRATRVASGAALLPSLDASANALRGKQDFVSGLGNSASAGLQAAWELDLFGGRRAARDAAQARLNGAQAGWHDARVSVAADVAITGGTGTISILASGISDIVGVAAMAGEGNQLTLRNSAVEKLAAQGVTPTSPIADKVKALKGLKIAMPAAGSGTDVLFRSTLKTYGVSDRDLTIQPVADPNGQVAAAKQGQVDGYMFSSPTSLIAVSDGWGKVWIDFHQDVPSVADRMTLDVITTKKYLSANQDVVKRVLTAMWRGWSDLQKDPDSVKAEIKAKYYPDLDQKVYDLAFAANVKLFSAGLEPAQKSLDVTLNLYNATAQKPSNASFTDVYDTKYVEETKP